MNQRNKIIIASLAFLIVVVLIFSRSGWIMLTARPVPSPVTQYPTPKPVNDEEFRKILPVPVSMEMWLERLNSKKIPETQIAEWKIYKNQEYGFELQYPSTWEITEGEGQGFVRNGKYVPLVFVNFGKGASGEDTSFVSAKSVLLEIFKISLSEYLKSILESDKRFIARKVVINGINIIIIDYGHTDLGNAAFSPMLFEHNGIMYSFNSSENEIIEYMIKSFHFVQ